MNFEHFIITRFNLRTPYKRVNSPSLDPEWLEMRCKIYENVALPSYAHQTNKNFSVIILANDDTPEPYRSRIAGWESDRCKIYWCVDHVYRFGRMWKVMREAMPRYVQEDTEWLVTTMGESDDALHEDYIKIIQEEIKPVRENILSKYGIYVSAITGERRLFTNKDSIKNVPTVVEPYDKSLITAIGRQCSRIPLSHRYLDYEDPLFVKIVHCGNIVNRLKGTAKIADDTGILDKFNIESIEV